MSRSFSVIVLCPNGRRETVKIGSNNSVLQILEEACSKQRLNPEDFDLFHYKKQLDLSLPIRFANLPNNALLELQPAKNARKDCLVAIALQLESGERLTGNFSPSSSLNDILMHFSIPDFTSQEKREAVCIYMRQQIAGEAIKTTTLRGLGLTKGSAIIRLMFRDLEQLDCQAHVSTPLSARPMTAPPLLTGTEASSSKSIESSVNKVSAASESKSVFLPVEIPEKRCETANNNKRVIDETTPSLPERENVYLSKRSNVDIEQNNVSDIPVQNVKTDCDFNANGENAMADANVEEMECDVGCEDDSEIGDINYIGDRHAVLYSLDDITDVKKADLPDEFFELTVKDVRYLMEEYKRERTQMENQPLLTKEQRERQLHQKFSTYSQTVIRIYFPERLVLQAVFQITETVQTVCEFVRKFLERDIIFYLYTTPPKEKLVNSKTLLECLLVPAAVVHFGSDLQRPCYLNANLRQQKSDPRAAALAAAQSRMENVPNMDMDISSTSTSLSIPMETPLATASLNVPQNSNAIPPQRKPVPKWLKLSKK